MDTKENSGSSAEITPSHARHLWHFQSVRDVAIITGIVALVWFGYWLRSITVPLLIAVALAYLVEPLVARLSRHPKLSRPIVVGGMVGLFGVLFIALLTLLPLVIAQLIGFLTTLPELTEKLLIAVSEYLPENFQTDVLNDPEELSERLTYWIQSNLGSIFEMTIATTGGAMSILGQLIGKTLYFAFLLFLIPFYFFCFSTGWGRFTGEVGRLFPEEHAPRVYDLSRKMDKAVSGFVRGRIVISVIMGIMLCIGWAFCGVPYWLLIGAISGILCTVPYLGGIGIPLAIGLLWINQLDAPEAERMAWWGIILWPSLVFGIVQLIEGYVLTPLIAGKATNLGPVSILVAVLAGGAVMGVYGMLLAIPIAACIKILTTEMLILRITDWAQGKASDILPISEE